MFFQIEIRFCAVIIQYDFEGVNIMLFKLLLLFIIIPLVELLLLIEISQFVGLLPTIFLIVITGIVGASLARSQGFKVLGKIKSSLRNNTLPADHLVDGLLILVGGVLLLTPGLLTDIIGFSFIIPASRKLIGKVVGRYFKSYIDSSSFYYGNFRKKKYNGNNQQKKENERVIDIEVKDQGKNNQE